jgi:hypothetical protein
VEGPQSGEFFRTTFLARAVSIASDPRGMDVKRS